MEHRGRIPASIVHSRQKQKLVGRLPLSCLLLETDSPVLAPEPDEIPGARIMHRFQFQPDSFLPIPLIQGNGGVRAQANGRNRDDL